MTKWPHQPNLRKKPHAPSKGRGPVQRAIRRVFMASGAEVLNSTEIYDWAHGRRRFGRRKSMPFGVYSRTLRTLRAMARKSSRYGHRDATMILIGYRHGLRASELCDLQWSQVELNTGRLHVRRAKNGSPSVHPLQDDEIRALRRLQREQGSSSHVFMTERDGPMTPKAFHALFGRIGMRAKMPFPIHPHMLRHGCGYALANAGHDTRSLQAWLGHKNIQHTVRYTELAPDRFRNFWR